MARKAWFSVRGDDVYPLEEAAQALADPSKLFDKTGCALSKKRYCIHNESLSGEIRPVGHPLGKRVLFAYCYAHAQLTVISGVVQQ